MATIPSLFPLYCIAYQTRDMQFLALKYVSANGGSRRFTWNCKHSMRDLFATCNNKCASVFYICWSTDWLACCTAAGLLLPRDALF